MISRRNLSLLINQKTVAVVLVLGAALVIAAGGVYFLYARDGAKPQPERVGRTVPRPGPHPHRL